MKTLIFALVLTSTVALSQLKEPGHPSRHASVGKQYGGGGGANISTPKQTNLEAELTKIEQQGAHVPTSSASRSAAATKSPTPKTPAKASRSKSIKYGYKAPQGSQGRRH